EGRVARIYIPEGPGTDWLDVLVNDGPEAVRTANPCPEEPTSTKQPGRVRIDAGSGDLEAVVDLAWRAIVARNDPPELFQRGGLITRIQRGDDDDPYLAIVTQDALRGVLARWIEWYRVVGASRSEVPSLPPMHVVRDMMAAP